MIVCLEHFFLNAVQRLYDFDVGEAAKIVGSVRIFHPYGTVGALPRLANGTNIVEFGQTDLRGDSEFRLAEGIKTYTEEVSAGDHVINMRSELSAAQQILFLGFGYHQQNMRLITPSGPRALKDVYATALGFSKADCTIIRSYLAPLIAPEQQAGLAYYIHLERGLTCAGLLDEFGRTLAGS